MEMNSSLTRRLSFKISLVKGGPSSVVSLVLMCVFSTRRRQSHGLDMPGITSTYLTMDELLQKKRSRTFAVSYVILLSSVTI